ncbi:MAG: hypothetical protein HY367_03560 [Candidatus Aenigmarchaeota archaeon]|nr:hypothetical protein [Candidatus Aenigmarchaeota archaeon]
MGAAGKVLIGLILLVIGLGLFVNSVIPEPWAVGRLGRFWLDNFLVVLTGIIPIFLIVVGLFIIWLEIDEMKTEKELAIEEKRAARPARKRKR